MANAPITGSQIVAARALTEVSQEKLAALAQIDLSTLMKLEQQRDIGSDFRPALAKIRKALEELGAVFVPERAGAGVGVRLKFGRSQVRAIDRWEDEGGASADDDVP
jgi:transcriptional regulator with XRE-family HTH domain